MKFLKKLCTDIKAERTSSEVAMALNWRKTYADFLCWQSLFTGVNGQIFSDHFIHCENKSRNFILEIQCVCLHTLQSNKEVLG